MLQVSGWDPANVQILDIDCESLIESGHVLCRLAIALLPHLSRADALRLKTPLAFVEAVRVGPLSTGLVVCNLKNPHVLLGGDHHVLWTLINLSTVLVHFSSGNYCVHLLRLSRTASAATSP